MVPGAGGSADADANGERALVSTEVYEPTADRWLRGPDLLSRDTAVRP